MTTTPAAPAAAPSTPQKTAAKSGGGYIVLVRHDESEGRWDRVGPDVVDATNANAAIKIVAGNRNGGVYIAVPARSWQAVKVTPTTQTKLVTETVKP